MTATELPAQTPVGESVRVGPRRDRSRRLVAAARLAILGAWVRLGAEVDGRRVPGTLIVACVAAACGVAGSVVSVETGTVNAYGDALSHLTIARRIFDSMAPGFEQMGTVWLPVPHLLLMPFVASIWMWHTGIGGCALGTLCLASSAASLYRIMARVGMSRTGRLLGLGVFLLNPTNIYMFTTALTEPVLIASLLGATAGIAGWALSPRRLSSGELAVFGGIPAAAAVMSRYEGWALIVTGTLVVAIVVFRRESTWRARLSWRSFGPILSFVLPSLVAVAWWLAYNWALYHDPFEFLFGQYSASAQATVVAQEGLLPTKGNLGLSFYTFSWSMLEFTGVVPLVIAGGGAVIAILLRRTTTQGLLIWLLATPGLFILAGLYLGQNVINNDHSIPTGWWNNRFAAPSGPFIAALCACVVGFWHRRRWLTRGIAAILLLAAMGQYAWFAEDLSGRSAVVAEAALSLREGEDARGAAEWLHSHYDHGSLLIDESASDNAVLPLIGIAMSQVYDRASGNANFDAALADPVGHVQWVFMHLTAPKDPKHLVVGPDDFVSAALLDSSAFNTNYQLVYTSGNIGVYHLFNSGAVSP